MIKYIVRSPSRRCLPGSHDSPHTWLHLARELSLSPPTYRTRNVIYYFLRLLCKPMYCLIKTIRKTADFQSTIYPSMYATDSPSLKLPLSTLEIPLSTPPTPTIPLQFLLTFLCLVLTLNLFLPRLGGWPITS